MYLSIAVQRGTIYIASLHKDAFITDPSVIEEYNRLQMLAKQFLPHTSDIHANIS